MAVDPDAAAVAYAAVSDTSTGTSRLFKTVNAGVTWAPSGLGSASVSAVAAGPQGLIYTGTRAGGPATIGGAVYKSVDGGATWAEVLPAGNYLATTILKIDTVTPPIVYRAVVGTISPMGPPPGSLSRTDNAGATWTDLGSINYQAPHALALDPKRSGVVYLGVSSGLYRSTDFGTSWSAVGTGLVGAVTAIAIDPVTTSTLYVGTFVGVLKSTDGGASFVRAGGSFGSSVSDLIVDPVRSGWVYTGTVSDGVFASCDWGTSWAPFNTGLTNLGISVLALDRTGAFLHAGTGTGVFDYQLGDTGCLPDEPTACLPDDTTACLQRGRFRVSVAWSSPSGQSGLGRRLDVTANTTGFWFFDPTNIELVIKVLDGRQINGKWWVFYGALSNVEYSITVTDTQTGATRTYFNPQGQLASFADTSAF